MKKETENFENLINRQRLNPKIWDYSYFLLKNNLEVFKKFKDLVLKENKTKILDVGCGFKPWHKFFPQRIEYIGVDVDSENANPDIIASADKLLFPDSYFDALIYSEILEHVENLPETLKEMKRVARNNALVFISSPFLFPEHGVPYDFQRLIKYFYLNFFKQDEVIILKESNSSIATICLMFNLFIESTPFRRFTFIKQLIFILTNIIALFFQIFLNILIKVFEKIYKKRNKWQQFYGMPLGYALVVRIKK